MDRKQAPVAQLDRALPSEGRGQRFESSRVRQKNNKNSNLEFFSKAFDTKTLYTHYTHRGYNTHK